MPAEADWRLSQTVVCAWNRGPRQLLAILLSISSFRMPLKGNRFMNGLPPSNRGRHAPPHPAVVRAAHPPVRHRRSIHAEMARHYVLSTEDLALVRAKRRARQPAWASPSSFAFSGIRAEVLRPAGIPTGIDALVCRKPARRSIQLAVRRLRPSGPRPAGSICVELAEASCAFGASGWPIGGPACRWARTPRGPPIAASRSSRQCSLICGRPTCFSRRGSAGADRTGGSGARSQEGL